MTYPTTPRQLRIRLLRQKRERIDAVIRTLEEAETNALAPQEYEDCGCEKAYKRHIRHGEKACQPCLDAHAEYTRECVAP